MDTTRTMFEQAIAMLKRHEGYRQRPYRDTVGKLTIGFGRNLEARGISVLEAGWLLMNDATDAEKDLRSLSCFSGLSPARQAALIDMCVNMGFGGVLEFHRMLAYLDSGLWAKAAAELRDSLASRQEPSRIDDLARLIESGEWLK